MTDTEIAAMLERANLEANKQISLGISSEFGVSLRTPTPSDTYSMAYWKGKSIKRVSPTRETVEEALTEALRTVNTLVTVAKELKTAGDVP